ncbi:COG1565: Uncharacterized conserved protein [invertebrate metagenome]|uniref:COG1565: Uncharacterized conserved protein n=1 Tax=invertebrate metagenome TaxID=1711999 RepID=A0A484H5U1_9ZZZZ
MSEGNVIARLRARICTEGPVTVATFMEEAATAYYAQAAPFGVEGDFVTAPEVSQMFGELVGLWAAVVWQEMGAPAIVHMVELGPGLGTLMNDLLRAVQVVPAFSTALKVHLVETSPRLASLQRQRLGSSVFPLAWHDHFEDVPSGPLLVVANEFLDTLPIHQFERTAEGWRERLVGLASDGRTFRFVPGYISSMPPLSPSVRDAAPVGALAEGSPAMHDVISAVAARLVTHGGAALFIDYGSAISTVGDSLQAVRRHVPYPVLEAPGKTDLTAHVDFAAATATARRAGACIYGPVHQGEWLCRLGLLTRAERLLAQARSGQQAHAVTAGVHRLIGDSTMGRLFKVLGFAHQRLSSLPGLDRAG